MTKGLTNKTLDICTKIETLTDKSTIDFVYQCMVVYARDIRKMYFLKTLNNRTVGGNEIPYYPAKWEEFKFGSGGWGRITPTELIKEI